MSFPGSILMGAQARLLDPTIPYRYFAAALLFHVILWGLIALYPDMIAYFSGGPGPALAALHSLTLGMLTMTAMGAAFQMLPVATGKPLRSTGAARVASWFFIPGVTILVGGMFSASHIPMTIGGLAVSIGLIIFVILIAELLWHARSIGPVSYFGQLALFCLLLTLVLGFMFIVDDHHSFLADRVGSTGVHLIVATYGFMGMLAIGFSHVLIPLFTLASNVPAATSRAVFALAVTALLAVICGTYYSWPWALVPAGLAGLAAAALHVYSMETCIASGMRKKLGVAGFMIRAGWASLLLSLILGTLLGIGYLDDSAIRLFVYVALFGWLLTFLLGVLQRILPFLGSMNATGAGGKPPLPSKLAPDNVLRAHAALHIVAVVLVGCGLGLEDPLWVRLGALSGLLGAVVYAGFAVRIWRLIHGQPSNST